MLVGLRISAWSARKYDRKVTSETNKAHGASADAGRYNKMLLPGDAPAYKALTQHIAATRQFHYDNTLAWSDDGWRMLTLANHQSYSDGIADRRHQFSRLLEELAAAYPALRVQAQDKLNGMWKDEDYPRDIRDRYDFDLDIKPVPSGGDFRVQLSKSEVDSIAARIEAQAKKAFDDAQADATKRLFKVLEAMHERLSQPEAIFRDSLIENARELTDVLQRLNLKDDPKLEDFRRKTELLAVTEPQTLRDDPEVRVDTAKRANDILDAMRATYGNNIFTS